MTKKIKRVVAVHNALWLKGIFLSGGVTSGRMPIKGRTSSRKRTVKTRSIRISNAVTTESASASVTHNPS